MDLQLPIRIVHIALSLLYSFVSGLHSFTYIASQHYSNPALNIAYCVYVHADYHGGNEGGVERISS